MTWSVQLAQIAAMMRYELKMMWRGRTLIVVMLALLALSIIILLVASSGSTSAYQSLINGQEGGSTGLAKIVVFLAWSPLGVTLALLLPILVADTIPKDQQLNVRELLDSLPITAGTYLTGKLTGVCLALITGTGVVLVIGGVMWRLVLGAYDIGIYLSMVVFGAWVLIVINSGLGVLLAAGQPERRRAAGLMIGLFIILPIVTGLEGMSTPNSIMGMLSPVRPVILNYFLLGEITSTQLAAAIVIGLVELGLVWLIVREWLKWRNRQA